MIWGMGTSSKVSGKVILGTSNEVPGTGGTSVSASPSLGVGGALLERRKLNPLRAGTAMGLMIGEEVNERAPDGVVTAGATLITGPSIGFFSSSSSIDSGGI